MIEANKAYRTVGGHVYHVTAVVRAYNAATDTEEQRVTFEARCGGSSWRETWPLARFMAAVEAYTVTRIDRDGLGGWKYGTRQDGSVKWIEERVDGGENLAALLAAHPPHYGHVIRRNSDGAQLAPDGSWIATR